VPLLKTQGWLAALWLGLVAAALGGAMFFAAPAVAQHEAQPEAKAADLARKAKKKVSPVYPDVARRMSITGTVRLAVVVTASGTVKTTKVVGGHPILVNAAMDAIKQWKFEPAATESSGIVEFTFQPQN
jgi:TonB family protein